MNLIINAHLDLAWNATAFARDQTLEVDQINRREVSMDDAPCRGRATTSLPEMRKAGIAVCVATLLARAGPGHERQRRYLRVDLDYPLRDAAYCAAQAQLAYYGLLERRGEIRILRTAAELDAHWKLWQTEASSPRPVGVILSMEGADPILAADEVCDWFAAGLSAVGPAHYGHGHYAAGTGVCGPLTPDGVALIAELDRHGAILDVTHLSDQSMAQALELFEGPVWASHHNCRSLVPGDRQLSDRQIRQLIARGAVIGAALDAWMLYPDWVRGETSPEVVGIDAVADHVDHVCQLAGNPDHAAIGSDLDGGFGSEQTPRDLRTIADLQKLAGILSDRGYSEADIGAVFHGNLLRFLRRNLPPG